jgi:signal transduction histidine kinase/DNA-binding response OmpR family regulator
MSAAKATASGERILLVESDPTLSDLIARQALGSQGFEVKVVAEASSAIQQVLAFAPDVVIANLELPGLSGKDFMAAFTSQNLRLPVIMLAPGGMEKDVIQAFRLGASDYVSLPLREAEVLAAVERALGTVRARRERERLQAELTHSNAQLQQRVEELTTISAIGQAVTSITDTRQLYQEIIAAAVKITGADLGYLLLLDDRTNKYILTAHHGLPRSLQENLNTPWDDGVSGLVALSNETLAMHGDALDRFKISSLGKSALVTPVHAGKQAIALITVLRKTDQPFERSANPLIEAVADYASISMVNARLFRALDQRAATLQTTVDAARNAEKDKEVLIQQATARLQEPLEIARKAVMELVSGDTVNLNDRQRSALARIQTQLQETFQITEAMDLFNNNSRPRQVVDLDIRDQVHQAIGRFQVSARDQGVQLSAQLPTDPVRVRADPDQIATVLDAYIGNAIKFSPDGGPVTVMAELSREKQVHVAVVDQGVGVTKKNLTQVFNRFYRGEVDPETGVNGLGASLSLVAQIITAHGGQVWAESQVGRGSTFHFSLPPIL